MAGSRHKNASPQGHTYVIDRNYRVVYLDHPARTVFPGGRIGALCYECFRGQSQPCHDCPWRPDEGEHATQSLIYSARMDQWYELTCVELEWFDQGTCALFSGRPVDESSRGLFASFNETSSYDELFELDLANDAYKVLFGEPDKYDMPPLEGSISALLPSVLEHMTHPDDHGRFRTFWDLDTLHERVKASGGSLRTELRMRLRDGSWGWVAQTVISVKRGTGDDRVVMCFVTDVDDEVRRRDAWAEQSHVQMLRERDQLTNLYNASTFYDKAERLLEGAPDRSYEAVYIDIEHFKIFNEWHGREAGNAILRDIAERLEEIARHRDGVAGYLGGDDFVLIVPRGTVTEERVEEELKKPPFDSESTIGFQPAIGIAPIDYPAATVLTACDHAMVAMNSVKGVYAKRVAWFAAQMTEEMETEAKILLEVKHALANREFVLHWQPQCNTRTGRIVGLEALVRWEHPTRGLVMPGAFIPVLERNNFIASLDLYVWEEACRHIRSWIDRGGTPLPVSVNISRADLYAIDVVETLEGLVTRYELDHRLLELEITESAYAEDERMATAVSELKSLGFTILMDDFGSGYSSLNMLKDITVDILKIDMGFLARESSSQRSESILEAVVSMARFMDLRIIAEGAETREQVDFLQDVGCEYAQGYYFYRPMPTAELEELLSRDGIVDYRGVLSPSTELIDVNALLHDDMISRATVDSLIGGLAVYAVYADHFELLQVNNGYYRVTGDNSIDLCERQRLVSQLVHPDDMPVVQSMFEEALRHPVIGAEATFRRYRLNGELMWMRMRAYFLRREQDRIIVFASLSDATEQKEQDQKLALEDDILHRIIQQSDLNVWVYDIDQDRLTFQNLSSSGIASLLAASSDEEADDLGDDVANVLRRLSREALWGRPAARTIKVWSPTGEPLTLHLECELVPDVNGKPARVIGYLHDPAYETPAKPALTKDDPVLEMIRGTAVDHWYVNVTTKSFLSVSDRLLWRHWTGLSLSDWSDTTLEERLGSTISAPEDVELIKRFLDFDDMLRRFAAGKRCDSLEYRQADGADVRWMELNYRMVRLEEGGDVYAYLSVADIDERKRRELDLKEKADHDSLTGLLNRQSASLRMAAALERTVRQQGSGAFAIIDLDDFKLVNDQYGHLAGDAVLVDVAQRLRQSFGDEPICRWGGDEFVVYCEGATREDATARMSALCDAPFGSTLADGRVVELSFSIGVAMVPEAGTVFEAVYEHADQALYRAKTMGKSHFIFFEPPAGA